MAARRVPSSDGGFINDLHEPFAQILEGLIQTHLNANPALGGSDLEAKSALRGSDPSASMTTSPTDVAVLALDQKTGERRYSPTSSRRFSHPKGLKRDGSLDVPDVHHIW